MSEPRLSVRVACAIEAPIERIYGAFLDPAVARLWLLVPPGAEALRCTIDGRLDGLFTLEAEEDGRPLAWRGRFLHLEPPLRLAFALEGPEMGPGETQVSVGLVPMGPAQIVSLVQEGVPAGLVPALEARWNGMFDRLAALLAGRDGASGEAPPRMA